MADPVLTLVTGALRSCINDHGPITHDTVSSAAKRLAGQLRSHAATVNGDSVWKRKLRDLQYGHKQLIARHDRLRERANEYRSALFAIDALYPHSVERPEWAEIAGAALSNCAPIDVREALAERTFGPVTISESEA